MSKAAKKPTTTSKPKKAPYSPQKEGIIGLEKNTYNNSYDAVFFKNKEELMKEIVNGNVSDADKMQFFALGGQEVKLSISIEQVPVTKSVIKAVVEK